MNLEIPSKFHPLSRDVARQGLQDQLSNLNRMADAHDDPSNPNMDKGAATSIRGTIDGIVSEHHELLNPGRIEQVATKVASVLSHNR